MSRNNFNMQNNNNLPVYNDSESLHYRQMNYKNSTKTGPADLNNNPPPSSRNGPPPGTQNNLGQPEMREAAGMSNNAGPGPNGPPPNIAPPMTGRHNSNGMGETGAGMNGDRGNLGPNGYSNPRGDMSHQMNMNMEPHRQNSMARQTSMPGQNLNEMRDPYSNSQYSLTDVRKWIKDLRSDNPEEKYNALTHLSRIREDKSIERELPNLLWHSPLTVTIILREIHKYYTKYDLEDKNLGNAISLMRVLADSDVTRLYFIDAGLPSQLYPFLDLDKSASKNPKQKDQTMAPRKHVLMLIFSLVKAEDEKVNKYLFDTEYMSKGMQIIQFGELTEKLIATFILFKILSTPKGLNHCCQSYDRFCHMDNVFKSVIDYVRDRMQAYVNHDHRHDPQPYDSNYSRLLNTVIKCYTSLCKNEKARKTLNQPTKLKAEIDISAAHLNPNGEYDNTFLNLTKILDQMNSDPNSPHGSNPLYPSLNDNLIKLNHAVNHDPNGMPSRPVKT